MQMLSRYKILSIGLLLFLTSSLIYFLLLSQRIHLTEELKVKKIIPSVLPIPVYVQDNFEINDHGIEELGAEPKMEDLNSYVMKAEERNYLRPSTLFFPSNSVEHDRRKTLEDLNVEEFTIVMMTYKRTDMMLALLNHLSGMPKLNQLLLIWNNIDGPPGPDTKWPAVDYQIRLLSNGKNSLHNRYLPLNIIKTEAVFLLDDDSFVVHAKVLLAFKKWQDHRDRIVGFKGRGIKWRTENGTSQWEYVTSPSPDSVSLVLTGSAFLHRNYFDLYTYRMPKEMRKIIDDTMNCDDLAINFLVSEVTQKGPIFVKHEKEFLCQGCKDNGLWKDASHFAERTNCLNQFSAIYGYTPLFKPNAEDETLCSNNEDIIDFYHVQEMQNFAKNARTFSYSSSIPKKDLNLTLEFSFLLYYVGRSICIIFGE